MSNFRKTIGKSAFTLVELLVVISIIAVLISLLIPAIAQSRETAKGVMCQSRIRDIYSLSEAYSNENKDWMFASLVWYSTAPYAYNYRNFRLQVMAYAPSGLTNWGYDNNFKNCILFCPSESPVWIKGTGGVPSTYYTDSMARGLLIDSGVAGYWANGFLGYGNIEYGGTPPRRRQQMKPDLMYMGEPTSNDPYNFGYIYGNWSTVRYHHGSNDTSFAVRVDGAVKTVKNPIQNSFNSGDMRWTQ